MPGGRGPQSPSVPEKAEFADMNSHLWLDEHRAYLKPQPDGGFLAPVVVEGPGAGTFLPALATSGNDFDACSVGNVTELQGAVPGGRALAHDRAAHLRHPSVTAG